MSRTIGGNPLRNAAIRQGNPLREVRHAAQGRESLPTSSRPPYTEEDRARLLAPISIQYVGGKTYAGTSATSGITHRGGARQEEDSSDRYAQRSDWADLDRLER